MNTITPDDETFWAGVREHYALAPDFINLENGYFGIPASSVRAAMHRYLDEVDLGSAFFLRTLWPQRLARVKEALAAFLAVACDEILITRSAVESLNILLQGYPFEVGDGIVLARHDYDSVHDIVQVLADRKRIIPAVIDVPLEPSSDADIVDLYAAALGPHSRVLLLTHIVHRTGQVMPVRAIADMARARGVDVIVDGAHSLAQLDYTVPDLGVQFGAFNLHKWVGAPLGTGLLYVARERIADIAPLFGDVSHARNDIDKLGHIGVVSPAPIMAVEDALAFHAFIGAANKEARLRWLSRRWMDAVRELPGVHMFTPRDPRRYCALGAFGIDGMTGAEVVRRLMEEYRIFTVVRQTGEHEVVRVTPHLYTSAAEVDLLVSAIRALSRTLIKPLEKS